MTCVVGPMSAAISLAVPTAAMRSPLMASASARGRAGSAVQM